MIAVDTNVLVRWFVGDDAAQTAEATRLIERATAEGARLFVSTVVLCETVWVLRSCYGFARAEIAAVASSLLATHQLQVERAAEAESALAAYAVGNGDFPDYLIRERAQSAGAVAVATFDRSLLAEPGFVHPDPESWEDGLDIHEDSPRYGRRVRRRVPAAATPASRS